MTAAASSALDTISRLCETSSSQLTQAVALSGKAQALNAKLDQIQDGLEEVRATLEKIVKTAAHLTILSTGFDFAAKGRGRKGSEHCLGKHCQVQEFSVVR